MQETNYHKILDLVDAIDPIKYARTRNFINGKITKLSPYISRGMLSLPSIAKSVLSKGYNGNEIEKLIQELAWREYFQRVWQVKGDELNTDLKTEQEPVAHHQIPDAIAQANTNITAIDNAIKQLQLDGYMHNHMRMYIAGITCNVAQSHWITPARWMYYYLLDADWASNALSWQWIAGTFSSKKYIANQENINKYMQTTDSNTFLDLPYEEIARSDIPFILKKTSPFELQTKLPSVKDPILQIHLPICIYNIYNIDPLWMQDHDANRILLLEPSFFRKYPMAEKTINFIICLANNISNMQIVIDEFENIARENSDIHYKEHPANEHYHGTKHERAWLFPEVTGYHSSFSSYWKKCERYFRKWDFKI